MDGGMQRASFCWWWDSRSTHHHQQSQWLHSTLSEVEQSMKAMLTLVGEEDGASHAQRAEMYYQKKPELMKRLQEFHKLYCSLAEYCNKLSARSSISGSSTNQPENFLGASKVFKSESSESVPKSSVDDPEFECYTKSFTESKSTDNGFKSCATDEMKSGFASNGQLVQDSGLSSPSEWRASYYEQISTLVEENYGRLIELARRNEEKREANRELCNRIDKLMKENDKLLEQQQKLIDENGALHLKLQKLMNGNKNLSTCSKLDKHKKPHLSRLKTLLLSTIWGGDSP